MIRGVIIINNHGKPRLVKFYQTVVSTHKIYSLQLRRGALSLLFSSAGVVRCTHIFPLLHYPDSGPLCEEKGRPRLCWATIHITTANYPLHACVSCPCCEPIPPHIPSHSAHSRQACPRYCCCKIDVMTSLSLGLFTLRIGVHDLSSLVSEKISPAHRPLCKTTGQRIAPQPVCETRVLPLSLSRSCSFSATSDPLRCLTFCCILLCVTSLFVYK